MTNILNIHSPLLRLFNIDNNEYIKKIILLFSGVIGLALASNITIPLEPVRVTFQSAAVVLIGMIYGPRGGTYVVATYLMAGALGAPVFADFSLGLTPFFGPTGGYLLGFLPAAFIAGYLAEKSWTKYITTSFIAACLSVSIIFISGLSYLATFLGWHDAILFGLMPFIVSEPIKLIIVAMIAKRPWK